MSIFTRSLVSLVAAIACSPSALAADAAPEPKTWMTERGAPLLKEDFNEPPAKEWKVMAPVWETVDGVLKSTHTPPFPTTHGPVMQRQLAMKDVILQVDFKLEKKTRAVLHLNKANGHLCLSLIHI